MSIFLNRKIATKMIIGFVLVALIAAVVGVIGIQNMRTINQADTELYELNLVPITYLGQMTQTFQEVRSYMYYAILAETSEGRAEALDKMNERRAVFGEAYEAFGAVPMSEEEQKLYTELTAAREDYAEAYNKAMQLIEENRLSEAIALMGDDGAYGKALKAEQDIITRMVEVKTEEANEKADSNTETANSATMIMIIVIAAGVVIAILIGIILSRLIATPIKEITKAAQKLSTGDVDVEVTSNSRDEVGMLTDAFSEMANNIKEQAQNAQKIAEGDLSIDIQPISDKDVLSISMKKVITELSGLVEEVNGLTEAAASGELKVRGNEEYFHGGYRDIVSGMNKTLDVIVESLNDAGEVLHLMSTNDLTRGMKDYKGDLKVLSDSTNEVRNRLLAIQELFEEFAKGDTNLLEEYQRIGKRSDNDRLIPSAIAMMTAIRELIKEANMLADAAIEGDLSVRGNAEKFEGGYREIIEGMNKTMDAVVEPIQETATVLQEIAQKDLTVAVKGAYKGEYARIKEAMNHTIESLNEILNEINASAEQVETGADQVAASSQNLSQGSSEQAGSVEEISASITQVAEQTKENAQNATKANDLSEKAKTDAQNGNTQMDEMLKAMNEIKESSKNISNIIKVIDEIAFQTNILALNAAVEAARAGEHGKGFAVVAEEVRNLAARSAKAAKETTDLIDNSINKVEDGYKIANDTAGALAQIVTGVTDAVEIVGMIANASNEQANAINEINQGIEQISQVTQSNTATAEESASASEEMAGQAQMLKALIQEFKIKGAQKKLIGNTTDNKKIEEPKEDEKKELKIELDDDSFGKY